jgi:hypothetical protein
MPSDRSPIRHPKGGNFSNRAATSWESELQRENKLSAKLQAHGPVGQAFAKLVNSGCDPHWLEVRLQRMYHLPLGKSNRSITQAQMKRLQRAARDLRTAADDISTIFTGLMYVSLTPYWPKPVAKVPLRLRQIASGLDEGLKSANWKSIRGIVASDRIPHFVRKVREQTGRPHFSELTTLIGEVYQDPNFSTDQLKMICYRYQLRNRT